MSDNVTEKARALANALRFSPEFIMMRAAEDAANQDEYLTGLYKAYEEKRAAVEELTMQDDPDYEDLMARNRELEELQAQYAEHPLAKAVKQSRRTFAAMMREVNDTLQQALNPEGAKPRGCSGACSTCAGCETEQ